MTFVASAFLTAAPALAYEPIDTTVPGNTSTATGQKVGTAGATITAAGSTYGQTAQTGSGGSGATTSAVNAAKDPNTYDSSGSTDTDKADYARQRAEYQAQLDAQNQASSDAAAAQRAASMGTKPVVDTTPNLSFYVGGGVTIQTGSTSGSTQVKGNTTIKSSTVTGAPVGSTTIVETTYTSTQIVTSTTQNGKTTVTTAPCTTCGQSATSAPVDPTPTLSYSVGGGVSIQTGSQYSGTTQIIPSSGNSVRSIKSSVAIGAPVGTGNRVTVKTTIDDMSYENSVTDGAISADHADDVTIGGITYNLTNNPQAFLSRPHTVGAWESKALKENIDPSGVAYFSLLDQLLARYPDKIQVTAKNGQIPAGLDVNALSAREYLGTMSSLNISGDPALLGVLSPSTSNLVVNAYQWSGPAIASNPSGVIVIYPGGDTSSIYLQQHEADHASLTVEKKVATVLQNQISNMQAVQSSPLLSGLYQLGMDVTNQVLNSADVIENGRTWDYMPNSLKQKSVFQGLQDLDHTGYYSSLNEIDAYKNQGDDSGQIKAAMLGYGIPEADAQEFVDWVQNDPTIAYNDSVLEAAAQVMVQNYSDVKKLLGGN
jgi:hypothetical protein